MLGALQKDAELLANIQATGLNWLSFLKKSARTGCTKI